VLVQSRTHLAGLRDLLRARGWPVHAVEIDALSEYQLAQDLVGLTRALLHFGDRVAWLAVLHAPWCGIGWADLHTLCADAPRQAIWDLLHEPERIARLSSDARQRAEAMLAVLSAAIAQRAATSLARWVEKTWVELGGPNNVDDPGELHAAEQFFALLARSERNGDIDDPARLHEALAAAQPQGDPPREQGIEIMTMHRAKGLEFDTVVLLGLGREPRQDDPKALHWMRRLAASGADDLIMAPSTGDDDGARLIEFVRGAERRRDLAERARLLYVATTRARERLHLVWQLPPSKPQPAPNSLLAHLWPAVPAQSATPSDAANPPIVAEPESLQPVLRRLVIPAGAGALRTAPVLDGQRHLPARPEFTWVGEAAVHVGTVVHRYLQQIADLGVESWTAATAAVSAAAIRLELQLLGVDPVDVEAATARVVAALNGALADPRGRWVLGSHTDARSELRMTLRSGNLLEHVRLDRTFVEEDTRWIIDFKTGQHEGSDIDAFLASEVERYRSQLERYARAITAIDARPVQVGLYFPLLQAFRSWPAGHG
jgi:ATP-dependent exoDNAse (exonuclease V) beta subunit